MKFSIDGNYIYWLEKNKNNYPMCVHRYFDKKTMNFKLIEIAEEFNNKDEIIVTFTTWKKRISNATKIIELIMNGTMIPDKIILNLAIDEFPNMLNDLPMDLQKLYYDSEYFEIQWL